jgi:hypothetical protein
MKLRYLITLAVLIISTAGIAQEEQNLKAFYLGYNKEYKVYSFEDADGANIEFTEVKAEVLKKYDLLSPKFIDQAFNITYLVKELGDEDDYTEEYTIIFLKPTVLERNQAAEDEDDSDEE